MNRLQTLLAISTACNFACNFNLRRYIKEARGGVTVYWSHGEAVQVEPMKFNSKAPGTKRLTLKYDEPLSNVAFNFNLRHYTTSLRTCS